MNIELNGPNYKPQSDIIENICIFFHGWGSNGDDLIELSPILSKYFPKKKRYFNRHCSVLSGGLIRIFGRV